MEDKVLIQFQFKYNLISMRASVVGIVSYREEFAV